MMVQQRLAGTDGRPGNRFTLAAAPGHGVLEPPVRRRAVRATSSSTMLRGQPDARRLERPGRRRAAPAPCSPPGTCTTTSTPTARSCSAASPAALLAAPARVIAAAGRSSTTPFDAADPVNTPRGLNTANPQRRQGARPTRSTDLDAAGHPARRAAARLPVRAPRRRARSRSTAGPARSASSTRSTSAGTPAAGLPRRAARLELRDGDLVQPGADGCPVDDALDPHLLAVATNPDSPYYADQTQHVLRQAVGRRGLLRERDRVRPGPPADAAQRRLRPARRLDAAAALDPEPAREPGDCTISGNPRPRPPRRDARRRRDLRRRRGDVVKGKGGDDRISAPTADDRLAGGAGDDQLRGGKGRDRLRGGAGCRRPRRRARART